MPKMVLQMAKDIKAQTANELWLKWHLLSLYCVITNIIIIILKKKNSPGANK